LHGHIICPQHRSFCRNHRRHVQHPDGRRKADGLPLLSQRLGRRRQRKPLLRLGQRPHPHHQQPHHRQQQSNSLSTPHGHARRPHPHPRQRSSRSPHSPP